MLPKEYRLRRNSDFRRIYRQQGKSYSTKYLVLYPKKNKLLVSRIGFSVSKKIGKAHVRNYYKRRLREISRHYFNAILPGYDLIFLARVAINEADFHQLQKDMKYLLKKSGVWCDEKVSS